MCEVQETRRWATSGELQAAKEGGVAEGKGRAELWLACWRRVDRGHSEPPRGLPTTHSSDTVYLSARGSQATLPIHTP